LAGFNNLLLYRTFQAVWQGKQDKKLDFSYQGPVNTLVKEPKTVGEIDKFAEDLVKTPIRQWAESDSGEKWLGKFSPYLRGEFSATQNGIVDAASAAIEAIGGRMFTGVNLDGDTDEEFKEGESFDDSQSLKFISRKASAILALIAQMRGTNLQVLFDHASTLKAVPGIDKIVSNINNIANAINVMPDVKQQKILDKYKHQETYLGPKKAAGIAAVNNSGKSAMANVKQKVKKLESLSSLDAKQQQRLTALRTKLDNLNKVKGQKPLPKSK